MSEKQRYSVYATQKSARLENVAKGGDRQVHQSLGQAMEDENSEPANDIKALKGEFHAIGRLNYLFIFHSKLLMTIPRCKN